mgnify:CR=1
MPDIDVSIIAMLASRDDRRFPPRLPMREREGTTPEFYLTDAETVFPDKYLPTDIRHGWRPWALNRRDARLPELYMIGNTLAPEELVFPDKYMTIDPPMRRSWWWRWPNNRGASLPILEPSQLYDAREFGWYSHQDNQARHLYALRALQQSRIRARQHDVPVLTHTQATNSPTGTRYRYIGGRPV